jgi:hypothetical protein
MRVSFLLLLICLEACSDPKKRITTVTASTTIQPAFACNYEAQKVRCKELLTRHKQFPTTGNSIQLINYITDSLLTCWYGTPWDFNGTTEQPGKGKIACGYFVTTVLRDAGLSLDRVKLAQCASKKLIETTCSQVVTYWNKPLENFVVQVKKEGFGLYIAGLDNHTGFVLNDGEDVYFIHAGVYPPKCALKEKAIESNTLRNSKCRVLGKVKF